MEKDLEGSPPSMSDEIVKIKTWYQENYSDLHISSQVNTSKYRLSGQEVVFEILWNGHRKEPLKSEKIYHEFSVSREFYPVLKLPGFENKAFYPLADKIIFVPNGEDYNVYFLKYFSNKNSFLNNSYGLNRNEDEFSGLITLQDHFGNLIRIYSYENNKLSSKGFPYVSAESIEFPRRVNSRLLGESFTEVVLEWDENTVTWDPEEHAWVDTVIGHTETIPVCFSIFGGGGGGGGGDDGGGGGTPIGDFGGPDDDIDAGSGGTAIDYFTRKDPCRHAKALAKDSNFRTNFQSLQNLTSGNFEAYYILSKVGDQYSYAFGEGPANSGEASFSTPHPISGYLHSHYGTGTLSIFSLTDVQALYLTAVQNNLDVSIQESLIGVVTGHGTNYLLKVDDPAKFLSFGAANFGSDSDLESLELVYNSYILLYSNFSSSNIIQNELAFLRTLENAGLVLLKGNSDFSKYQKLSLVNNSVRAANC
ncbi:hypothetical protein [Algoriphagus namhaensis]